MNKLFEKEVPTSKVLVINFVVLVVLVALPAGGYIVRGKTVRVSALSSPFNGYGVGPVTFAAFFVLFVIAARMYGHRWRVSPLGYVIVAGWVLGLMVPDIITSANRSIPIGVNWSCHGLLDTN